MCVCGVLLLLLLLCVCVLGGGGACVPVCVYDSSDLATAGPFSEYCGLYG